MAAGEMAADRADGSALQAALGVGGAACGGEQQRQRNRESFRFHRLLPSRAGSVPGDACSPPASPSLPAGQGSTSTHRSARRHRRRATSRANSSRQTHAAMPVIRARPPQTPPNQRSSRLRRNALIAASAGASPLPTAAPPRTRALARRIRRPTECRADAARPVCQLVGLSDISASLLFALSQRTLRAARGQRLAMSCSAGRWSVVRRRATGWASPDRADDEPGRSDGRRDCACESAALRGAGPRELQLLDHPVAHHELLHLAGDRSSASRRRSGVARHLVVGDLVPAEVPDLVLAERRGRAWRHDPTQTSSPYFGSGTPNTCTDCTFGWRNRNSSTSRG